jgi:TetR/AcrR family transcriptional regulator, cholesterol catabolism regulator
VSQAGKAKITRNAQDAILDAVVTLLEEYGYDGWQLRDVAALARASFTTIYKYFPSRELLIVAALERWMEENVYRAIEKPSDDLAPFETLREMFHAIFEPWEQHPQMLQVYVQASTAEGGDRLTAQGYEATASMESVFKRFDRAFASDVLAILTNVVEGLLSRYVMGLIAVTDILTTIERTLYRLECAGTSDPEKDGPQKRPSRSRSVSQGGRGDSHVRKAKGS